MAQTGAPREHRAQGVGLARLMVRMARHKSPALQGEPNFPLARETSDRCSDASLPESRAGKRIAPWRRDS